MQFVADDLLYVTDQLLPARFGGAPTDYQFLEHEENGLPVVELLVSPRIGTIEEEQMLKIVQGALAAGGSGRALMSDRWAQGNTLRIVRREPRVTAVGKVLALHVDGAGV